MKLININNTRYCVCNKNIIIYCEFYRLIINFQILFFICITLFYAYNFNQIKILFFSRMVNIKLITDFTIDFMLTIDHNKINGYLPILCYNLIFTRKCSSWLSDRIYVLIREGIDSFRITNEIFFFEVNVFGSLMQVNNKLSNRLRYPNMWKG